MGASHCLLEPLVDRVGAVTEVVVQRRVVLSILNVGLVAWAQDIVVSIASIVDRRRAAMPVVGFLFEAAKGVNKERRISTRSQPSSTRSAGMLHCFREGRAARTCRSSTRTWTPAVVLHVVRYAGLVVETRQAALHHNTHGQARLRCRRCRSIRGAQSSCGLDQSLRATRCSLHSSRHIDTLDALTVVETKACRHEVHLALVDRLVGAVWGPCTPRTSRPVEQHRTALPGPGRSFCCTDTRRNRIKPLLCWLR